MSNKQAILIMICGIFLVLLISLISKINSDEVTQKEHDELHSKYETLQDGYIELQQDYSKKVEQIEYLEYRIMTDDNISPELKQEIKENVLEEGE